MKKLYVVAVLAAALAVAVPDSAAAQSASKAGIKNIVLVHGAFADGSGWEGVAEILKKDGYTVSVVQHPETSYADDFRYAKDVIDNQTGPVVLAGPAMADRSSPRPAIIRRSPPWSTSPLSRPMPARVRP